MNAPGETLYADPAQLERWREKGGKPPVVTYARGPALDPGNATARLVRGWIEQGIVETVKEREQGGVMLHAVRLKESGRPELSGGPANVRPSGSMPGALIEDTLTPRERRLLELVRGICGGPGTEGAAKLPGCTTLAQRAQLRDRRQANNILRKFERLGLVKLEPVAGGGRRAVLTEV